MRTIDTASEESSTTEVTTNTYEGLITDLMDHVVRGSNLSRRRAIEYILMDHGIIPDNRTPSDDFTPIDDPVGTDIDLLGVDEDLVSKFNSLSAAEKKNNEKWRKQRRDGIRIDILRSLKSLEERVPEYISGLCESQDPDFSAVAKDIREVLKHLNTETVE